MKFKFANYFTQETPYKAPILEHFRNPHLWLRKKTIIEERSPQTTNSASKKTPT